MSEERECTHKVFGMDRNESERWISEHTVDAEQAANGALPHHNGAHPTAASELEKQQSPHEGAQLLDALCEEVDRLLLEAEGLRDHQQALQRTPASSDTDVDDDAENKHSDDSDTKDPADRGRVLHGRPVRLILALAVAALLCAGGLRFWHYLQSYEWTDDAEIDGHLDPISTRVDGTVVHVYVENTYHVKQGQALVDLDPRDYQVAVENAAANLAQAQQGVKAAQQNYGLGVANLAAAVATNAKAQVDVARYRELLSSLASRAINDGANPKISGKTRWN